MPENNQQKLEVGTSLIEIEIEKVSYTELEDVTNLIGEFLNSEGYFFKIKHTYSQESQAL